MSIDVIRNNPTMAYGSSLKPTKAYGANTTSLLLDGSGGASRAFVYFSAPIPAGAIIDSAVLRIRSFGVWSSTHTLTVERITQKWTASRLTWTNQPSATATDAVAVTKVAPVAGSTIWDFDVKNQLGYYSSGQWFGFRVSINGTTPRKIWGKGTRAPQLIITYHLPLDAPEGLRPGTSDDAETLYIGTAKPTLVADWDGAVDLESVQVQLSDEFPHDFVTPTWDSLEVATTVPELRLSDYGGAPAPTSGNFMWWRMRQKGTDDNWTAWSDPIRYYYKPLPTLTITTPAAGIVNASTTPIAWSFTGGTQEFYRVQAYDPSSPDQTALWDTGRVQSASTTVGVPEGVLTRTGHPYTLIVQGWDTEDRQAASNGLVEVPTYAQDTDAITYELSNTVAPVTNLASASVAPLPHMRLTWDRSATALDFFEVARDGVVVATDLLPSDLLVSGTSYEYVDRTASPKDSHTWEVRAISAEVTSSDNPTTTNDFFTGLLWISDMENDIHVAIAGEAPAEIGLVEQGATFDPLGAEYAVRVTGSLGRHKGKVSGDLCGECIGDGTTSSDLQNMVLAFRKDIGKVFYLYLENLAIPVVIYNVSTYPLYGVKFGKVYGVEFEFHEVKKPV